MSRKDDNQDEVDICPITHTPVSELEDPFFFRGNTYSKKALIKAFEVQFGDYPENMNVPRDPATQQPLPLFELNQAYARKQSFFREALCYLPGALAVVSLPAIIYLFESLKPQLVEDELRVFTTALCLMLTTGAFFYCLTQIRECHVSLADALLTSGLFSTADESMAQQIEKWLDTIAADEKEQPVQVPGLTS